MTDSTMTTSLASKSLTRKPHFVLSSRIEVELKLSLHVLRPLFQFISPTSFAFYLLLKSFGMLINALHLALQSFQFTSQPEGGSPFAIKAGQQLANVGSHLATMTNRTRVRHISVTFGLVRLFVDDVRVPIAELFFGGCLLLRLMCTDRFCWLWRRQLHHRWFVRRHLRILSAPSVLGGPTTALQHRG